MHQNAVNHILKKDKILGKHVRRIGPMTLSPAKLKSPYESLAQSIAYQQLNGKAAATIWGRVAAIYSRSEKGLDPKAVLETPDERLRGAGLSASKVAALKDLSLKATEGLVPTSRAIAKMADEEIIERLTTIRGIGEWTVHMLLIFKLGRPDVLPAADYGVRQGFKLVYGGDDLPKPKELLAFGERWRPYRTAAAWYLWRVLDSVGGRA